MLNKMSLLNVENYKEKFYETSNDVIQKYISIIIEYLHFVKSYKSNPNRNYIKFILLRGLETISHVFIHILYYTKNIHLAEYHSQKSMYDYLEYVGQISEDKNMFLQLTSQDAVVYVYKKTIYDLIKKYKSENNTLFLETMTSIENIVQIYKNILSSGENIVSNTQTIVAFEQHCKKFNKIKSPTEQLALKFEKYALEKIFTSA